MKLHEAMREALAGAPGRRLHRADLALVINQLGLYHRKDCSQVPPNQVSARASKRPDVFEIMGHGIVALR